MQVDFQLRPGSAAATLSLGAGETVTTEGGAMISMSGDMSIETSTHQKGQGGMLKGLKRMLTGENFFLNHYTAGARGGEVILSSTLPGDMFEHELDGETLVVQAGSFVACESGITLGMGWQGFKTLISKEGLFWLHLSGRGKMVLNSFGAIYPVHVDGETLVDTGHIVAFQETLSFSLTKAGGSWLSSILGGEGLVCKFKGKGTVWCQSHNPSSFGWSLSPMLRKR
jgi:uncharacterized protein (TIGR00266 family)